MLFGHRESLRKGNLYMAHRTGFSSKTLLAALQEAGFGKIAVVSRPSQFLLWAIATKTPCDDETIAALARQHVPGFTGQVQSAEQAG